MGTVEILYRYRPFFKLPHHYVKYLEPVYEGFENFSFNEVNYEIMQKDIRFLENSRAANTPLQSLTNQDFEKVVDVFEKFVFLGESPSRDNLVMRFIERMPKEISVRIPKEALEYIYQKVSWFLLTLCDVVLER